jgi:hypothetical protein
MLEPECVDLELLNNLNNKTASCQRRLNRKSLRNEQLWRIFKARRFAPMDAEIVVSPRLCGPVQLGQDVISERLRTISQKSLFRCNRFSCDYNPTYVACIRQQNCLFFLKHPVVTAGVWQFGVRSSSSGPSYGRVGCSRACLSPPGNL